jgi:branched-chain amino acid transport system permease protein
LETFIQQLVNGVSLGSIYALIALGYTMVYGIIKLINFAHGEVYMIGAFVGFAVPMFAGNNFIASLLIAMGACALLGFTIEKIAYKPLRNSSRITLLITAIGVSLFLQYTMKFFAGAQSRAYPELLKNIIFEPHGIVIKSNQITIILTTIVLMFLLQFIVKHTKPGKAMRAVSLDRDAAQLMGIDVDKTISFTFLLGSALAGAAGVLVGIAYNTINPFMGLMPGLKAFVAAVFGGIGNIPGAMIGGFTIGIIETMVGGYSNSMYRDAVVFALLIVVLIIKPSGLLGKTAGEKV